MAIDEDIRFLAEMSTDPASSWSYDDVVAMSGRRLPDIFLGDQQPILLGDQYRLWLRWFLEGLVSPLAISRNKTLQRLDVFAAVLRRVDNLYHGIEPSRRRALTDAITDHIYAEVERLRAGRNRDYALKATKFALVAERAPPRCYICGFEFPKEAVDAFLQVRGRDPVRLPPLVDVFRPRLSERDLSIEIEHVVPVAQHGSGQDNLRLACGWCNKHKSARVSLYEAAHLAPRIAGFRVGPHDIHELPHPFWAIRILALRGRCQHSGDCDRTAKDAELFVSLIDWGGSPNPINLAVYCQEHDPIAIDRFQARAAVQTLWRERKR